MPSSTNTTSGWRDWKTERSITKLFGVAGITFVAFGGLWYWLRPGSDFVPLAFCSSLMGFFFSQGASAEVKQILKEEIARRDREVDRMAAENSKLHKKFLTARTSSTDKLPKRRRK